MTTQTAVIVGAGSGMGAALARRFLNADMNVVVASRDQEKLDAVAESCIAATGKDGITAIACDARDEKQVADLFARAEKDAGPVTAAVYNAGAWFNAGIRELPADMYENVWRLGAFAGFLVGREAARCMVDRGAGSILFTGATASMRGGKGFAAFAGAKFALRALAQSMARELGPEGIHVAHVVIDGRIATPLNRERFGDAPAGTMLDPDDIAEVYYQLHSQPKSAWTFEIDLRPASESF